MIRKVIFILLVVFFLFSIKILKISGKDNFSTLPLFGKVVRIVDGDTIVVLNKQNKQIKIRLYGIDTPEKKQAFGQKAKQFTANLVWKKQVKIKPVTIDRYGRIVGIVYIGNRCLNYELIANGYAWVYRRYCTSRRLCKRWLQAESRAKKFKLGLWHDPNSIPPWEWRKNKKKNKKNKWSSIFSIIY